MDRKRKILSLILALALLGGAAFALGSREPALELYTSPLIRMGGKTVRVRLVVPQGWVAGNPHPPLAIAGAGRGDVIYIDFTPVQSRSWLERWLPMLFHVKPEAAKLQVDFHSPGHLFTDESGEFDYDLQGVKTPGAYRTIPGDIDCAMIYVRSDRAAFDATRRRILDSFRVIPER